MTISVTVSNIELMTAADIARLAHMLLTHNGHSSPMVANPPSIPLDGQTEQASPAPLPVISFPEVVAPRVSDFPFAEAPPTSNPFRERAEYQSASASVHQSRTPLTPEAAHQAAKADVAERHAQQAPGIEVDKSGLPWDGRIHASTRAKNADGTWRMRRGIEEALVTDVTGELRQTMAPAVPQPPKLSVVPPVPVQVVPPPFAPSAAIPAVPENITPATALAGAAGAASHSDAPALTFPRLMQLITTAFTAKTLSQEAIGAAITAVGLPSLPMLASRPDLVQAVADKLELRA